MARAEMIVLGLAPAKEFRHPSDLADAVEVQPPPCQHLVRIALVAHIENQSILGRIEDVVDGGDEFDGAETRSQVPAGLGDALENLAANFVGHLLHRFPGQGPQIRG